VFGEEGDVAVIGATALEISGLEVDVVRGCLRRPNYFYSRWSIAQSSDLPFNYSI